MLIAMAGLPGSGKSTAAAYLAERLGAVVLDKDRVRAALFPPPVLDYSAEQDEITMAALYRAAAAILSDAGRTVLPSCLSHPIALDLGEEGGHSPIFALLPFGKRVVMALRALQLHAEK